MVLEATYSIVGLKPDLFICIYIEYNSWSDSSLYLVVRWEQY